MQPGRIKDAERTLAFRVGGTGELLKSFVPVYKCSKTTTHYKLRMRMDPYVMNAYIFYHS